MVQRLEGYIVSDFFCFYCIFWLSYLYTSSEFLYERYQALNWEFAESFKTIWTDRKSVV